MDIKETIIKASSASIMYTDPEITVELINANEADLIAATVHIPLEKIVAEIGHNDLLDAIGKDKCMEYFNLFEPEN